MSNIIIFYKSSKLAKAPDELFKLLRNSETPYVFKFISKSKKKLMRTIIKHKDRSIIIHFHNKIVKLPYPKNVKKIIHYHSEPTKVHLRVPNDYHKLVLNQYHCTLPPYKKCNSIVRNFYNNNRDIIFNDKIKVGYFPSTILRENQYYDKGFLPTTKVLFKLKRKYPDVIFDIGHKISYKECMKRKRDCHILIDECITGSFHKTTIEGLMLGCNVIVCINDKINKIHKKLYGQTLPVCNTKIGKLEDRLKELLQMPKEVLEKKALLAHEKFKNYWSSEIVAKEYMDIYDKLLKKK
jgi:hypothetical protein